MNILQIDMELFPTIKQALSSNEKIVVPIDSYYMQEIYNYFNHQEELIDSCKSIAYGYVFKGGINLYYGYGTDYPISDIKKLEYISTLKKALDYKKMFGMCPIHIHIDKKTKQTTFKIPDFGTGLFAFVIDPKNLVSEIIWIPFKSVSKRNKSNDIGNNPIMLNKLLSNGKAITISELKLEKKYKVFVWEDTQPSTYNGKLKTSVSKLLQKYYEIREFKNNIKVSDHSNAHQIQVVSRQREQPMDITKMTEKEIFADLEIDGFDMTDNPNTKAKYERQVGASLLMEMAVTLLNRRRQGKGIDDVPVFNPDDKRTTIERRSIALKDDNMIPLQEGEKLERPTQSKTIADFQLFLRDYQESVYRTFGMDKETLNKTSKLKAVAEQSKETLEVMVNDERTYAKDFFNWAYDQMFREYDNRMLAELLQNLDDQEERLNLIKKSQDEKTKIGGITDKLHGDIDTESEKKTIQYTRDVIKSISSLKYRITIEFPVNPFEKKNEIKDIEFAKNQNVLTAEEEVNMIRQNMGLDPLPPNHEIIIQKEKMKKLEIKFQEKNLKELNENGGGNGTLNQNPNDPSNNKKRKDNPNQTNVGNKKQKPNPNEKKPQKK